jgi:hypothetical protein
MFIDTFTSLSHNMFRRLQLQLQLRLQVFGLIDLCYIFVIHMQQDATQRNKICDLCLFTASLSLTFATTR